MELGSAAGGGVMLALAAGLWMVYLVPSWLRRREYDATERNAVRLQQTLRVLAETAEVPHAVRAETTARSVAEQQRTLKQQQLMDATARARDASAARAAARELAALQPTGVAVVDARALAARRLRRTRAVTSLILLAAVGTLGVQFIAFPAALSPLLIALATGGTVTSVALLGRLARVSRSRSVVAVAAPSREVRKTSSAPVAAAEQPVAERVSWTPVGVPKPLYQSRTVIQQPAFDSAAVVAEMRAAAAAADAALRAAQASPEVVPIAAPSRFAAMGLVDSGPAMAPDLDAVLRRRRQSA
jgi:hypothetical protein